MRLRLARAVRLAADRTTAPRLSAVLIILLALAIALVGAVPAAAQEPTCYAVADAGGGDGTGQDDDAEDQLTKVTLSDPDPATNEVTVGNGTGTFRIEAATFRPGTETLYAANGGQLGTVSLTTGNFTALAEPAGSGPGDDGVEVFDNLDGLIFDPDSGALYASERRSTAGADLLVRLDPSTGAHIPDAFGAGADYVIVEPIGNLDDVDDLAISPSNGKMYAIANDDGVGDVLVTVDRATGATTEIGPVGVDDMEGLTFTPGGTLIGTVGKEGETGEAVWDIDPATGEASNRRPLDNATDYETISCIVFAAQAPEVGSITVVKDSRPDSPVDFDFSGDLGDFSLDDDGNAKLPGSRTWEDLDAGNYEVVEAGVSGWKLTKIACVDPDDGTDVDVGDATVTIDLDAGENVVCTFTNARLAVLGGPVPAPLPAAGTPGLGALSLIGFGMISAGAAMRRAAREGRSGGASGGPRPGAFDAYAAYRVTGLPTGPGRSFGRRARTFVRVLPARRAMNVDAPERGPPRALPP